MRDSICSVLNYFVTTLYYIFIILVHRSWPTLHLEPLSPRHNKELVHALCLIKNFTLSSEDESRILSHCRMPATRHPLYVTVLIDELIHSDKTIPVREKLDMCLKYAETAELYRYVLESLEREYEGFTNQKGMIKRVSQVGDDWRILQV